MENIPTDAETAHAMQQYGGQFVKQLAQLWLCADPLNQARVKLAFGDYFDRYREVAARTGVPAVSTRQSFAQAMAEDDEDLQALMDRDMGC